METETKHFEIDIGGLSVYVLAYFEWHEGDPGHGEPSDWELSSFKIYKSGEDSTVISGLLIGFRTEVDGVFQSLEDHVRDVIESEPFDDDEKEPDL